MYEMYLFKVLSPKVSVQTLRISSKDSPADRNRKTSKFVQYVLSRNRSTGCMGTMSKLAA